MERLENMVEIRFGAIESLFRYCKIVGDAPLYLYLSAAAAVAFGSLYQINLA